MGIFALKGYITCVMANPYDDFLKEAGALLELDWRKYRRRASRRNLQARLAELKIENYGDYLELLRSDAKEAARLPELLRVTVSRFFRERSCWTELADRVLPQLVGSEASGVGLRAWSCGCCNGEEPYSLAMLMLWRFPRKGGRTAEIIATDIDEEVLARAEVGCYESNTLREMPEDLPEHYLVGKGNRSCVSNHVKELVSFKRHELMTDEPPTGMDLVLCRYLAFTYYLGERRHAAALRLWRSLRPGGALMVGRKDILGPGELELFEPWSGTEAVFSKRIDAG